MIAISDINELNKIMRLVTIQQSELDGEMVRNSLSTYGEDLDKLLFKTTYNSICPCDILALFELISRDSSSNVSMTEEDDKVTAYKSYTFHVIFYGNDSATVATKYIARMRTELVRTALLDNGVYIEKVNDDKSLNEFKQGVMIHRHDVDVDISCMMSVEQVSTSIDFTEIDEPDIIIYKGETNV